MQSFIKNLFVPVIFLLVMLSGCGGGRSQAPPPESPYAPLVSFSASSNSIISGDFVTLTWNVTNATSVSILPNVNEADDGKYLALIGACTLVLQNTTTYVLTAQGQGGTTTKQLTVEVRAAAPTISLVAEPGTILPGASATVRWSTEGHGGTRLGTGQPDRNDHLHCHRGRSGRRGYRDCDSNGYAE